MVMDGLLKPEEIPEGWGLVYLRGRATVIVKEPKSFMARNLASEISMLVFSLRDVQNG